VLVLVLVLAAAALELASGSSRTSGGETSYGTGLVVGNVLAAG